MKMKPIGYIHSPYQDKAPYQPTENDEGEFYIELAEELTEGLRDLEKFRYIYVLYFIHRLSKEVKMNVSPPWADGKKVGLFSSRSPVRPNPIGLSIVKILKIKDNRIYTSGLDAFHGTPVLDIKPYIQDLDNKEDANGGWLDEMEDLEHLKLHIKGIPHEY